MYLYSAKNNAFVVSGSPLLDTAEFSDAKEVSDEIFQEFFQSEVDGKCRTAGPDDLPVWIDIPPLSADELHAQAVQAAELKRSDLLGVAQQSISLLQLKLLAGRKLTDTETSQLNAVLNYIDAVQAVDTSTAPSVTWPSQPTN